MLRFLIAPDKFKGSLDSFQVCAHIEKGLRTVFGNSDASVIQLPLADGGDGLLDIIAYYTDARIRRTTVTGPLFKPVQAEWLLSGDGRTAYVEMAKASGLQLLQPWEYDCRLTTSYGTGELIAEAVRCGAEEIILGIGGSATNDGGAGMAAAWGYRFLDENGAALSPAGGNLIQIARIEAPQEAAGSDMFFGERRQVRNMNGQTLRFRLACDVRSPLYGPSGATRVYAPQKGAGPEAIEQMEEGMVHYAALLKRDLGMDVAGKEGAGAAGGMGAACMAFLGAEPASGVDLVFEYSRASRHIQEADIVLTGEGRLDEQTPEGKVVAGVAALGKRYNKPVIAICGSLDLGPVVWQSMGITAAFSIIDRPMSLEEARRDAGALLENAACTIGRMLNALS